MFQLMYQNTCFKQIASYYLHYPTLLQNTFYNGRYLLASTFEAVAACWAHNPEVRKSKLRSAKEFLFSICEKKSLLSRFFPPSNSRFFKVIFLPQNIQCIFPFFFFRRVLSEGRAKSTLGSLENYSNEKVFHIKYSI